MTITVHAGGSLFKGNEIKRAVQTGQAKIGERLLSAHQNENPLYGIDSVPFLATSFAESDKLWNSVRDMLAESLASEGLVLLYSAPPGRPRESISIAKSTRSPTWDGIKFRAYNVATSRFAELTGMLPVQIEAADLTQGPGNRSCVCIHFLGLHRVRPQGLGSICLTSTTPRPGFPEIMSSSTR